MKTSIYHLKAAICIALIIIVTPAVAQEKKTNDSLKPDSIANDTAKLIKHIPHTCKAATDEPIVCCVSIVDSEPEFPGGAQALMKFLAENIKYPPTVVDYIETGKVILQFTVEKDGSITDITVIQSLSERIDNSMIDVVKKMPKWTPGKQKGEPVALKYTLPVLFNN